MHFTIEPYPEPSAAFITAIGELDVAAASLLRTTITRSLDDQCSQVCLDLRQVTFVDAAGLQALARAQAEAAIRGARLEITEWSWAFERIAMWTSARSMMRATSAVDA